MKVTHLKRLTTRSELIPGRYYLLGYFDRDDKSRYALTWWNDGIKNFNGYDLQFEEAIVLELPEHVHDLSS